MTIRRKLFLAMASFIVGLGMLFALLTHFVVRGVLHAMLEVDRSRELRELAGWFAEYYERHGSWEGVGETAVDPGQWNRPDAAYVLLTPDWDAILTVGGGNVPHDEMMGLGARRPVRVNGETAAFVIYYDRELGNMAKIRYGISGSVSFLLLAGSVVLMLISLFVAYRMSRRLTSPLRQLIPAIVRLRKGEWGVQAPVVSRDEIGEVARAFNEMSEQLRRTEQARKNMMADVAHELRTPLTIVRGQLDLFQQSGQAIRPEQLLPLQDELIRLSRLVDDLHQLSLAEARRLPLERRPTDLSGLLRRIMDRLVPETEGKSIALKLDAPGEVTALVDPHRITQVLLNLLVNAVRYTPPGGTVHVSVAMEPAMRQGEPGPQARIAIADTGPGIAPEHLPHLFDRFYRTDEARSRDRGGMGLGLAIAKEFVLAHGGTIDVESRPGKGTTFIVTLPVP